MVHLVHIGDNVKKITLGGAKQINIRCGKWTTMMIHRWFTWFTSTLLSCQGHKKIELGLRLSDCRRYSNAVTVTLPLSRQGHEKIEPSWTADEPWWTMGEPPRHSPIFRHTVHEWLLFLKLWGNEPNEPWFSNSLYTKKIHLISLNIFFSTDLKKDGSFGSSWR